MRPRMVDIEQSCQVTKRGEPTIRRWAAAGQLRWKKDGSRILYYEADLLEMVGRLPTDDQRDQELLTLRRDLAHAERTCDRLRAQLADKSTHVKDFQRQAKARYAHKNRLIDQLLAVSEEMIQTSTTLPTETLLLVLALRFESEEECFVPQRPVITLAGYRLACSYAVVNNLTAADAIWQRYMTLLAQIPACAPWAAQLRDTAFMTIRQLLTPYDVTDMDASSLPASHSIALLEALAAWAEYEGQTRLSATLRYNIGLWLLHTNHPDAADAAFARGWASLRSIPAMILPSADPDEATGYLIEAETETLLCWLAYARAWVALQRNDVSVARTHLQAVLDDSCAIGVEQKQYTLALLAVVDQRNNAPARF